MIGVTFICGHFYRRFMYGNASSPATTFVG